MTNNESQPKEETPPSEEDLEKVLKQIKFEPGHGLFLVAPDVRRLRRPRE